MNSNLKHFLPEPLCPICGRADARLVTQRDVSHDNPIPTAREAEETIYTFKCQCGVTFLHSVPHSRSQSEALSSAT